MQMPWKRSRNVPTLRRGMHGPGGRTDLVMAIEGILNATAEAILVADAGGVIRFANTAVSRLFGYDAGDLIGRPVAQLVSIPRPDQPDVLPWNEPDEGRRARPPTFPLWQMAQRFDGSSFPVACTLGTAMVGGECLQVVVVRDVQDDHGPSAVSHDLLTGWLNRIGFLGEVGRRLGQPGLALLSADLDRFREVNETLGHTVGDAVLRAAAVLLESTLPPGAILARISADEFAALVPNMTPSGAARLAETVSKRFASPLPAERHMLQLNCSVGCVLADPSIRAAEELLGKAQLGLQEAKARGGGVAVLYTPTLAANASRRAQLRLHMAQAIARNEFALVYQPIVNPAGNVVAAEALLRWNHSTLGAVPPTEFIPLAEDSGLIVPVTGWVLVEVARQLRAWEEAGLNLPRVYVNVSGKSLNADSLIDQLGVLVGTYPMLAGRLGIEITEQAAIGDFDAAVRMIERLAGMGIQTAIDDFGTGYSSLSYLQRLPVHALKIDRSFIDCLPGDGRDVALVRAAIGLAKGLGLEIVAEGVETVAQRDLLVELGCDRLQGYLFSKPLGPDALLERMGGKLGAAAD